MTPRPVLKPKDGRPVSAVYIGKGAAAGSSSKDLSQSPQVSTINSPRLPELPETPSPSSSIGSVKSGLPSPPGTNSTESGSTGDPATIAVRSRPVSLHSNSTSSTSSGSHSTPVGRNASSSRSSSRLGNLSMDDSGVDGDFDDDYDKENDHDHDSNLDGDDTARLDRKLLSASNMDTLKTKTSSENQVALRRAKSLAQRNRLTIDKLSRLGSPSPARSGTPNSRSPALSQAGSSRSQTLRTARPSQAQRHETIRSGSETERESAHQTNSTHSAPSHSHSVHRFVPQYSNTHRSISPPPNSQQPDSNTSPYNRLRRISAPASPHKGYTLTASASSDSNSSQSPSNRRRNRASTASVQLADFEEEDEGTNDPGRKTVANMARERKDRTLSEAEMITQSALAAVASSRRSPLGHRRRSALPREFRSDLANDSPPDIKKEVRRGDSGGDKKDKAKNNIEPLVFTPFRPSTNGVGRASTVRERLVPINPRWSSDDYRTPATVRTRPFNTSYSNEDGNPRKERRQTLRVGSVESALLSPGGRSLISEGLRAAGITRRKDDEQRVKPRSVAVGGMNGDVFKERVRKVDWSPQDVIDDGSRRALVDKERDRSIPPRASTSMAQYQYLDRASPEDPRGHRTTHSLVLREHDSIMGATERTTSVLGRYTPGHPGTPRLASVHLHERLATASPFGSRRQSGQPLLTPQTEHARLMLDSLTMFETSLAKITRSTSTVSAGPISSQTDLLQNAQGMVFAADRLYNLLKQGSAHAIEAQVEAEVESAARGPEVREIVDLWGKVAADHREGSRMADDLIRGITGVLLGIGRVMREFMSERVSDFGSPSVHGRHASLGDEDLRRMSPDVHASSSGGASRSENSSEKQSVSSRQSWDPLRDRDREREEALRRLAGGNGARSESVLARASPATFQRLKVRNYLEQLPSQTSSPAMNGRNTLPQPGFDSVRRSFTPRERREDTPDTRTLTLRGSALVAVDSQETIQPSPTPVSRQRGSPAVERPRALPPLSIPKPLPTLPSETLLRREKSTGNELSFRDRDRRRATIRGSERPVFPSLTSPANPTIALTPHTVSNSERSPNLLQRTDSNKSSRSQVTFSRPTAFSVEKSLSDLQQADGERKRTISLTSPNDEAIPSDQRQVTSTKSGSKTDRDTARKVLGLTRPRMSLDIQREDERSAGVATDSRASTSHAADRSAATTILTANVKRERRRTVTDIWPR